MYDRTFLVVSLPCFTTNFTTNSPQQLAPYCPILQRCQPKHKFHKSPKFLAKQGIPGQIKEKQNNDKNTIHLPRQHMPQHNG